MKLGDHFISGEPFCEHHAAYYPASKIDISFFEDGKDIQLPAPILFQGKKDCVCFAVNPGGGINNSYYIGTDWLTESKAVYVQPKINRESNEQVNYVAMLFDALKHPDVFEHTHDLFEIKWEKPEIKINQQQDLLTPLLIIQYLQVVKNLARKGLKKSYYKVERNLHSRVKGKILVAQNIKQNLAKSKSLDTVCSYEEFGFDGIENRILKKALLFVQKYLAGHKNLNSKAFFSHTFNYIMPAFEQVSGEASIRDCQHIKINPFYKEYKLAIELAKQILKRFGYNIQNTSTEQVNTPPFWIDMSKLFELYVLGLLKDKYKNIGTIDFQFGNRANKLDFLLNTNDFAGVVDAKYKLKYSNGIANHDDIRQVSGYARLKKVYDRLGKTPEKDQPHELIDCLIIYPEGYLKKGEAFELEISKKNGIEDYAGVYKCGVKLPVVSEV